MSRFFPAISCWVPLLFLVIGCGKGSPSGSSDGSNDESNDDESPAIDCLTSANCDGGGVCRDEKCLVPAACTTVEDCGINSECDVERGICVECLKGEDCSVGETCLGNVCRGPCEASADCKGELQCAENGFCAECIDDGGCADDEHCRQGACVADKCQQRGTVCTEEGSVLVCSERGDHEVKLDCPGNESCGTEQGPAWCQSWICTPGQSFCGEEGNIAHTCSEDGLNLAASLECGETNSKCVDGICEPIICEPFTSYCKNGDVYTCGDVGTTETVSSDCSAFQYCDDLTATCRLQECTPGEMGCQDGQAGTCNDLGSAYEDLSTCNVDEACDGGACEPMVCTALQRFCDGNQVRLCNDLGTGSSSYMTCSAGQYCNDSSYHAVCSVDVCAPSELACDGNTLGTCNAEGSGIEPDGRTDCTVSGQVCSAAECKDVICTNLERLCVSGDVHNCVDKGSATQLYDNCTVSEYCDEDTATCQTQICSPGQPGCDGQVARTCNADGSGWEEGGTDCAPLENQVCDAGSCKEVICSPGGRYCEGTEVRTCNTLGTGGPLYQACSLANHCYESSPTNAFCRSDRCTADAPVCSGELASICAGDGSGPLPGGTDCTDAGEKCWNGSCEPQVCTASVRLCVGGNYHSCISNGTATSLYDTCTASEYCDDGAGCQPQVCTPDADICNGDWVTTCESDGSGPNPGGTDCALSDQVCHAATCKDQVCVDGEYLCDGKELKLCKNNGTLNETQFICAETEFCDVDEVACFTELCEPNESVCSDADAYFTCNAQGSAYGPRTACADGERCEEGACLPVEDLCSLEGKTWSTPHELGAVSYAVKIAADARGNIFAVGTDSSTYRGVYLYRYDAATDLWSSRMSVAPNGTRGVAPHLAVAANGTAVLYWRGPRNVYADILVSIYDPIQDAWSTPESVRPQFDASGAWDYYFTQEHLGIDAYGRFALLFGYDWARGLDGLRAIGYSKDTGWTTSQLLHLGWPSVAPSLAVSTEGKAVVAFGWGGELRSVRLDLATGVWSSIETAASLSTEPSSVAFTDAAGTSAVFLSGYTGSYPFTVSWFDGGGYIAKSLLPTSDYSSGKVFVSPTGEQHAFIDTAVGYRALPGATWTNPSSAAAAASSVVGYPSGELLALASGVVVPYLKGVGWTTGPQPLVAPADITALPGCRAAAVFRNASNKLAVSILE